MARIEIKDSREAMFYMLEDARRRGDYTAAAAAQQRLRQLGVIISYDTEQRSTGGKRK